MKWIVWLVMLVSLSSFGQGVSKPPMKIINISGNYYLVPELPISGYTRIFARYEWTSGAFDSVLYIPRYNGVPSGARVSENSDIDGKIAVDTANNYFYYYSGGAWVKVAKYGDITIPTLQQVLTTGSTLTTTNNINLNGQFFSLANGAKSFIEIDLTPNLEYGEFGARNTSTSNNANTLYAVSNVDAQFVSSASSQFGAVEIDGDVNVSVNKLSYSARRQRFDADTLDIDLRTTSGKLFIRKTTPGGSSDSILVITSGDQVKAIAQSSIVPGAVPISSLTAATGDNVINNGNTQQFWGWNSYTGDGTGGGLILSTTSTAMSSSDPLFLLNMEGANSGSGLTTVGARFNNHRTGTSSSNIAAKFEATSGANNYAIIVPASSGSVGIGTSAPTEKLEVVGGSIMGRWKARVGSTTSSATPTINTDNVDIYKLTAQAAAITSFTSNLSGTPNDGDILEIQITDDGTPRTIAWGASFVSSSISLPTTTVTSTTLTTILQYYTTSSYGNNKWVCVNSF